jgi:hypothetical protein
MNSSETFEDKLATIRRRLEQKRDYPGSPSDEAFFGGADVIIDEVSKPGHERFLENQPMVLDPGGYDARRRVVITTHARRLSELLYQFRDSDFDEIESDSKYRFYGTLAQAALDYLQKIGDPADQFAMFM